ncbi:uncharacterized protein LOC115007690 [Cottoperca gobio]|uniref:Uncharacterized protein LOC115007690 n=1 Tax=Cottoperca gobio TaxID=56716 RepID=A0A6J2PKA9_COTGO|nr:uncharacterized protein LOC115007690 [Cottoperca gobio]
MTEHLLLVVLMCSFTEMKAQALLTPTLTVNPPVISDTDSVTLHCQTPSSVSQCYFKTMRTKPGKVFPCLKTLTGTELLEMSHQSSPAEVEMTCFYTVKLGESHYPSPHSDTSSVTIHSETSSVTIHSDTSSVTRHSDTSSVTIHSDTSSVTIHTLKPEMSLQHFPGEYVIMTCTLPGSAHEDTRCNLYFGEERDPSLTTTIWKQRTSKNQWFCQFTVTISDLLHFPQRSVTSCDYSLGSEPNSLSPRSDGYSLTGQNVGSSNTGSFISTSITPVKPTSAETWTWNLVVVAACLGGVILLGLALLFTKRRTERCSSKRTQADATDDLMCMRELNHGGSLPAGNDEAYSVITSVPAADCPTGLDKSKMQEFQNEDSDIYHVYSTMSEEPPPSALKDMVYSTLQAH